MRDADTSFLELDFGDKGQEMLEMTEWTAEPIQTGAGPLEE